MSAKRDLKTRLFMAGAAATAVAAIPMGAVWASPVTHADPDNCAVTNSCNVDANVPGADANAGPGGAGATVPGAGAIANQGGVDANVPGADANAGPGVPQGL